MEDEETRVRLLRGTEAMRVRDDAAAARSEFESVAVAAARCGGGALADVNLERYIAARSVVLSRAIPISGGGGGGGGGAHALVPVVDLFNHVTEARVAG